jgi:ABC-type bacteriocin/lantibiotic exporter with double-glycine peptidase domain
VIATSSRDTLVYLASGAAAALALELYLYIQRSKRIAYIASRFDGIVQVRALAAVINLPLALTERAPLASQLARFRQFELGRELFAGRLAAALLDLPFTLLFLAMLFVIGGSLGFVPLGIGLVMIALAAFSVPASLAHTAKVAAGRLKVEAMLLELATKIGALRGASAEPKWLARYGRKLGTYERTRFESMRQSSVLQIATNALIVLAGVATLGVGAQHVIGGTLSLGGLVACMIIVWRMLLPVQIVSLNLPRLWQLRTTVRQIDDLMRMRPERDERAPLVYRRLRGSIGTSGLYLNLGTRQEPQLRGVNIDIQPGEIVVVTGPSGSGKSTLLKVLLGLYPQYVGTVRLGGLDMRQLDPAEIRAAIGYASDDLTFFYGTVAGNLRFAFPDATDHDIVEALAAVGIRLPHPDLPEGVETRISATASRSFSQGMLCRLSLARAFVKKSSIILLDDAHSGLDAGGDAALISHLNALRGNTTVVLVTARPSHMRIADRILIMNAGAVAISGKPENIIPGIMEGIRAGAA